MSVIYSKVLNFGREIQKLQTENQKIAKMGSETHFLSEKLHKNGYNLSKIAKTVLDKSGDI